MVIFHSYVSLPEGTLLFCKTHPVFFDKNQSLYCNVLDIFSNRLNYTNPHGFSGQINPGMSYWCLVRNEGMIYSTH